MAALIEAARAPDFPAEIALVVSNKSDAGGPRARQARGRRDGRRSIRRSMPAATHSRPRSRRCWKSTASNSSASPATCASSARPFVERWRGRHAQHPSLAAARLQGPAHPRARARRRRRASTAAPCISSTPNSTPVRFILQARVPVLPGDDAQTLAARVLGEEHQDLSRGAGAARPRTCGRRRPDLVANGLK